MKLDMAWKRPDNVPYPSVWSTFFGKKYPGIDPVEYKIQDITEDLYDEIVKHMKKYFVVRETVNSALGTSESEPSIQEEEKIWRDKFKQRMGLVALAVSHETGEEKIAGVNLTCVVHKSEKDSFIQLEDAVLKKLGRTLEDLEASVDIFNKYNVVMYMTALGLSVAPHYSGENIGYQLLMARTKLCRATGVPLTVTAFTNPTSIYLATKAGFHVIAELNYETYMQDGKLLYPKLKGHMKLMAKEINESTDS